MKTLFEQHTHGHRERARWGLGGNRLSVGFAILLLALICIMAFFLLGL